MKKSTIQELAEKIKKANSKAVKESKFIDNGSFNNDTLILNLAGWLKKDIEKLEFFLGFYIGRQLKNFKGYYFIFIDIGNSLCAKRTEIIENTCIILKKQGVDCLVWYNLD